MPSPQELDIATDDDASQLEDLQVLLEIAHTNEKKAQQNFARIKEALDITEMAHQQALFEHKEEQLNNRELKLAINAAQEQMQYMESAYEKQLDEAYIKLDQQRNECSKFKKLLVKQHHENDQLKEQIALLVGQNKQLQMAKKNLTFFREPLTGQEIQERIAYHHNKHSGR